MLCILSEGRIIEVKKTNDGQFPIIIELNSGSNKFTIEAAFELKEKLDSLLNQYPGYFK